MIVPLLYFFSFWQIFRCEILILSLSSTCLALATTYKVNVFTSDKFGTGTNANVYITIFGDLNDTGLTKIFAFLKPIVEFQ